MWSYLSGNHLQCVEFDSTVDFYMTFQVESRPVPWWGVLQWYALFCSGSCICIVCTCGTGRILAVSFWVLQSPSLVSIWRWYLISSILLGSCSEWSNYWALQAFTCAFWYQYYLAVVVVYPLSWPLIVGGGSPIFPRVLHQPDSTSLWTAVKSVRRGLSSNPGVTMWCVCGCSWRDDVCRVCGCYRGGIVVMDVIWVDFV